MSSALVAIDGPAGSGKSTVARAVADALGWSFLDTGAMYRALTFEAIERGFDLDNEDLIGELADSITLSTLPRVTLNGRDVHDQIRSEQVNVAVSKIAANARVRRAMVARQRDFALQRPGGIVVEGRDITTVVFPNATLKIFLTASLEERTGRRGDETADSVARRDVADSTRDTSPLRQATDAHVIDTTGRSVDDVVQEIIECLKNKNSI